MRRICGKDIPIVLIGDPAYPLLPWLIKAFPDNGSLSQQQCTFNYRLSNARVIVEHSYGRLKGRWRCLLKRIDVDIGNVPTLVSACTVLHNTALCRVLCLLFSAYPPFRIPSATSLPLVFTTSPRLLADVLGKYSVLFP